MTWTGGLLPADTEVRIRQLCGKILEARRESGDLGHLIRELRITLEEHICRAKSSLGAKAAVIRALEPEE